MGGSTNVLTGVVCPSAGLVICLFMWFSPFPAVLKARQSRDLGSLNPMPFVAMIFNCIGWTMYGCMQNDIFLFLGNISGLLLGLFYAITSLTIIAKKSANEEFSDQFLILEGLVLFAFFFWCVVAYVSVTAFTSFDDPKEQGAVLVGTLGAVFSIAYYAAPLSTMVRVVIARDSSSLYFPMILVNLVNAFLWTSYGAFGVNDINIWLPNALGIILSCSQIFLIFLFKRGTFWDALVGNMAGAAAPVKAVKMSSDRVALTGKASSANADVGYDDDEYDEELLENMQSSSAQGSYMVHKNPLLA